MAEYLIVAGMSGAGRSSAAAVLEDTGWFVIDNLPVALITKVAELASHPANEHERFCFVAGRGGPESVSELGPAIDVLKASGARVRVCFLDASDEVLVRRFEGTRRRHPFETEGGVLQAIQRERELLQPLRDAAEEVIDTSSSNVHELRARLQELFDRQDSGAMQTTVVSFGFKHGLPLDVDLVLDCRFLPNPHWVEELRPHTGLDEDVRSYVLDRPEAQEFLAHLDSLFAFLLPAYAKEGKSYLSIAIGCTGGRHRSVAIAEELGKRVAARGYTPNVVHRDLDR